MGINQHFSVRAVHSMGKVKTFQCDKVTRRLDPADARIKRLSNKMPQGQKHGLVRTQLIHFIWQQFIFTPLVIRPGSNGMSYKQHKRLKCPLGHCWPCTQHRSQPADTAQNSSPQAPSTSISPLLPSQAICLPTAPNPKPAPNQGNGTKP